MAIVYSYPLATPELQDLLVGTEMAVQGGESSPRTRTFTIQSIVSLIIPPFKSVIKATYASMIADGTPTVDTIYTVLNDENKSYVRATYLWKTNGQREWIATTPDN